MLGGLSGAVGYFWEGHDDLGGTIAHLLGVASPWALALCAAVLLGLGLYQYRKAKTAFRSWDGEDEDVMQQAEERLSRTLLLDSLTVIVSFFFFNAGTEKLPQGSDGNTVLLLVVCLAVIALAILLQQKTVDLTKKMNPEKRGLSLIHIFRNNGIRALTMDEGDQLVSVRETDGSQKILIATHDGMAVVFDENDVRPMGRSAMGVRGIRLREDVYKRQEEYCGADHRLEI